jgi:branched-chain amino acid transport system ATP-binding protein
MVKQYAGINGDKYTGQKPVVYTPDRITHMGIARTFQNIRLFKSQTAFENVLIATHLRRTSNFLTASFRLNAKEEKAMREKARNLLETVGLAEEADELATSLPYGKQRRLEIARALATDPTLLLLDEPAAGMNPQETDELGEFIVGIKNRFNLTVFMIEHHMNLVMNISDRIYVLEFGKQIAEGTPEEIQKNPAVIAAYLGVEEE